MMHNQIYKNWQVITIIPSGSIVREWNVLKNYFYRKYNVILEEEVEIDDEEEDLVVVEEEEEERNKWKLK